MPDEARAIARFVRTSPRKARRVVDLIRGKDLKQALAILKFTPNIAARAIEKVVNSAAANAETNHDMSRDFLWVSCCYVDEGPAMKRLRRGSMGRGGLIRKRMSHITVVVSEREEMRQAAERARRGRRRTPRREPVAAEGET